jgi:hypothetical protein
MAELKRELAPANWQITATTIDCDMVHEYVTLMVHKDWSYGCTWCARYKQPAGKDPKRKFARQVAGQLSKCTGPDCKYVTEYRDKLIKEEKAG